MVIYISLKPEKRRFGRYIMHVECSSEMNSIPYSSYVREGKGIGMKEVSSENSPSVNRSRRALALARKSKYYYSFLRR